MVRVCFCRGGAGGGGGRSPHCGAPMGPHPPSQVFINYLKYLLIIKSDVHPLFSLRNELHNCTFYLEMTLKMALSVIFIIIFVISAPKYNNIPIDSEIGDFPFSELYPFYSACVIFCMLNREKKQNYYKFTRDI